MLLQEEIVLLFRYNDDEECLGTPFLMGGAGVAVVLGLASAVIHRLTTLAEHRQQFISKFVRFNAGK